MASFRGASSSLSTTENFGGASDGYVGGSSTSTASFAGVTRAILKRAAERT